MIVPLRSRYQRIHDRRRNGSVWLNCNAPRGAFGHYCAAIQASTQAASSSLSAGRASGIGEPQGGVGESF